MASDNPLETLIGRHDERATRHDLAASVRIGVSRVLLLTGDAGIGKTAVLKDLAEADHQLAVLALAAVTRADRDADRRAWHLAAACIGPSEEVALLLENLAELQRVRDWIGMSPAQQEMFRNVDYLAWRGDDGTLARSIESCSQAAMYLGLGGAETMARTASMIVNLCAGDYESAYHIARRNHDLNFMQISMRVLPDLIESAARSGRTDEAREALAELTEIATASETHWGLGFLERPSAILSEQGDPESHYLAAISHLSRTRARADLARSHLLYGEWLRRHKRRRDARGRLGSALEHFEGMGAADWIARTRREISATGPGAERDPLRWQAGHLTPQESAVGRLAAGGATNAEIAAALVLSPHTVDYHLRKVYRKLGVNSRRDLSRMMASLDG